MIMYFAGAESNVPLLEEMQAKNLLFSYWAIKDRSFLEVRRTFERLKSEGCRIFVDSGAHTFIQMNNAKQRVTEDLDKLVFNYIAFLEKMVDVLDVYAELDIPEQVGKEKVAEWRKVMWDKNLKPLLVYHPRTHSLQEFEEMCKMSDYLALGGGILRRGGEITPVIRSLMDTAKEHKVKIHGFGCANQKFLEKLPLYSVDATSWLATTEYGHTPFFDGKKLHSYGSGDKKYIRSKMKDYIIDHGLNYSLIERDDNNEVLKLSLLVWKEFAEYIDSIQTDRYWEEETNSKRGTNEEFVKYKGKIEELRKDPEIEEKRLANLKTAMKGNLFALKTGEYSQGLPLYCNDCYASKKCPYYRKPEGDEKVVCALSQEFSEWFPKDFEIRNEVQVNEIKKRILSIMLDRLSKQLWFEALDGGIQDRNATALAFGILDRLEVNNKAVPLLQQANTQINIGKVNSEDLAELRKLIPKDIEEKMAELIRKKKNGNG